MLVTVEVALAQVFDPDEAFGRIVKINLRHADSVAVEKLCDLDVMPVFFALQIVPNQDQSGSCRICTAMDSIKFPVRTSFFDRPDFYLIDIQTRKMHSRLSKKQRGSHS